MGHRRHAAQYGYRLLRYLPYACEQVSLTHHEAVETLLPEMPFPAPEMASVP
jgi:hypothetical protein